MEQLLPKHKSICYPSKCRCLEIAFVHGWLALHFVVIGSVQRASSLKTPPVLSRGPLLSISCLRSLLDLPINGQNSGMSSGASWRHEMLGRRATDGTERAKHLREKARERRASRQKGTRGKSPPTCSFETEKVELIFKLKSIGVRVHSRFSEIQSLWRESPHGQAMIRSGLFSVKRKRVWRYCTHSIQVTSD